MTALAAGLFALSALMLLWSYLLYPPLIRRLARQEPSAGAGRSGVGERPAAEPVPASIEVLVSAADEETVISERVSNLLAQKFGGSYGVAIGCDGSADRTGELASAFAETSAEQGAKLRVAQFPVRRGKAAVLNDLVAGSQAEVLIFTDANTRFEPGAVSRLAEAFRVPDVGAACGRLVFEGSDAESAFWDWETRMKEAEGRLGVCLGANGAIYAARRAEVEPLPPDTTSMDDFLIPLRVARRGGRIVFVADSVAREDAPRSTRAEVRRRFRIGIGAGQVLRRETWLWNVPRRGLLSLAFFSRKVARWLAPVAAMAAIVAACMSPQLRPFGLMLAAAAATLALSARAQPRPAGLAGKLYYFGVVNLALGAGVVAGLCGYSRPVWKPVER